MVEADVVRGAGLTGELSRTSLYSMADGCLRPVRGSSVASLAAPEQPEVAARRWSKRRYAVPGVCGSGTIPCRTGPLQQCPQKPPGNCSYIKKIRGLKSHVPETITRIYGLIISQSLLAIANRKSLCPLFLCKRILTIHQ